jgi:hypothetical protein
MVDVHRWTQRLALGTYSFFEHSFHLLIRVTGKTCEGGYMIRPILDRAYRHDSDRGALQPRVRIKIALRIAGSVAFRAFSHFFHQIFAALDVSLL